MTKNSSTAAVSALILMTGLAAQARADGGAPTCRQWQQQKMTTETCLCAGQPRRGEDRGKICDDQPQASYFHGESGFDLQGYMQGHARQVVASAQAQAQSLDPKAALPDAPKPQNERKLGLHSVTVDGGYITGADGSGAKNGSVAVEFYRQKTKVGTLSGEAEIGRYQMGGIPINDRQDLGVVGQLPDGTPVQGTAITTGKSPAVTYTPFADFKFYPRMPKKLDRLHPYAVGEFGMSRLSSTDAKVDTKIVSSVGGQPVDVQDMGSSLQPTGAGKNHPGGGFGGGSKFDVTKGGRVQLDGQVLDAPTGYKVAKVGVTINFGKKKK